MRILLALALITYSCTSAPTPTPAARPYTAINLQWQASPSAQISAVTYRMYRNMNSGPFTSLAQGITTLQYRDMNIQRRKTYCYKVAAQIATMETLDPTPWCITTR